MESSATHRNADLLLSVTLPIGGIHGRTAPGIVPAALKPRSSGTGQPGT